MQLLSLSASIVFSQHEEKRELISSYLENLGFSRSKTSATSSLVLKSLNVSHTCIGNGTDGFHTVLLFHIFSIILHVSYNCTSESLCFPSFLKQKFDLINIRVWLPALLLPFKDPLLHPPLSFLHAVNQRADMSTKVSMLMREGHKHFSQPIHNPFSTYIHKYRSPIMTFMKVYCCYSITQSNQRSINQSIKAKVCSEWWL